MNEITEFNYEKEIDGVLYRFNIGKLANQAGGAVLASAGETMVLVTATMSAEKKDVDFFPLTVDYMEKMYAAGKIPGGFFKRGGRPTDFEILKSRLMDRPLRPLFPKYLRNDVQVIAYVLSSDSENQPDILAIQGASLALCISNIPFDGPVSAVRIGKTESGFILNTPFSLDEKSDLDLIVAETSKSVVMVESKANEITEEDMVQAFILAKEKNKLFIDFQLSVLQNYPNKKEKAIIPAPIIPEDSKQAVSEFLSSRIEEALFSTNKQQRENAVSNLQKEMNEALAEQFEGRESDLDLAFEKFVDNYVRQKIVTENKRPDGRKADEIRPITMEVGLLPRVHGSGLFKRGQTQVLSLVTLGSKGEGQLIEGLSEEETKHYMHYYNFPPFSVGEVRPMRGAGRREIGHGALAERALLPVIPSEADFPYTIHVVSEVLESNGSSSMASVCGSTISLMDAGIPIKAPVAGIAMGLFSNESKYKILTDIQGVEDATGDMDFKVAGTKKGITALQMDVKTQIITIDIIQEGLTQAKGARFFILDKIETCIPSVRDNLSQYAPRLRVIQIKPEKIGELIGPQGKNIKRIIEETGVKIDIEPDGKVYITSPDEEHMILACAAVGAIAEEPELGKIYKGKVVGIREFGAFVEIIKGKDGLVHISEISQQRVNKVEDVLKIGQEITVKVIRIDNDGKVSLTMKGLN
jgi:polyribonucleotide nucleotidyltransferase